MNVLDIIIIIPLAYALYKGFKKGLIHEVCTLIALFLGIWGAIEFSDFASDYISRQFDISDKWLPIIAFLLTFIIIVVIVNMVGKLLDKIIKMVALSFVNKCVGAVFAILKMWLILSVCVLLMDSFDKKLDFIPASAKSESVMYKPTRNLVLEVIPGFESSNFYKYVATLEEKIKGTFDKIEDAFENIDKSI